MSDTSDRLATVASEAFGPFPCQTDEENLTAIENGIADLGRKLEEAREEIARLKRPIRCHDVDEFYRDDTATGGEVNQCDGCRQGLPVKDGLHVKSDGHPFMACTRSRYGRTRRQVR